jgi:hypothetical protein
MYNRTEIKKAYTNLVGKPERKRQLDRPKHRLKFTIKMNHNEIG